MDLYILALTTTPYLVGWVWKRILKLKRLHFYFNSNTMCGQVGFGKKSQAKTVEFIFSEL
jgi:hypothetical protein